MPKKQIMMVLSNAIAELEDEFNDWYSNTHIQDQLRVPGFVGAQRFKLSSEQREGAPPCEWKYLTIWEIETDDPLGALAETKRRLRTPELPVRDDTMRNFWAYNYEPITPRLTPDPEE